MMAKQRVTEHIKRNTMLRLLWLFYLGGIMSTADAWFFRKKQYTPLLFFKVPSGLIPECDEMEAAVSKVEKDLGVAVERLDVARVPENEALLALLTQRSPPFLYHRESCQSLYQPNDVSRIRAWAKGRYLGMSKHNIVKAPTVVAQEQKAMEQEELLDDLTLTDLQKEGKERMKERDNHTQS